MKLRTYILRYQMTSKSFSSLYFLILLCYSVTVSTATDSSEVIEFEEFQPALEEEEILEEKKEVFDPLKSLECVLPPFTNVLPLKYRREMRKIWSGFVMTIKRCERQLTQTKELIDTLPAELKLRVMNWNVETTLSPSQKPFLVGVTDEDRAAFSKILANLSLSENERHRFLREWASTVLDMDAVNQFEQYLQFITRKHERFMEKVKRLSPEAKTAYIRLEAVRREKQNIYDKMSPATRKELADMYRNKCAHGVASEVPVDDDEDDTVEGCIMVAATRIPNPFPPTSSTTFSTTPSTSTTTTTTTPHTILIPKLPKVPFIPIIPSVPEPARKYRPRPISVPQLAKDERRLLLEDPNRLTELLRRIFPHNHWI